MWKIQKLLPALIILIFTGCGDSSRYLEASISDVTKPQQITLTRSTESGNVFSIYIKGEGSIAGKADISLMLDGKPYRTEKLDNDFVFVWSGDWYSDVAEIIYTPENVVSGNIKFYYRFEILE